MIGWEKAARLNTSQGLVITLPNALSPPVVFGPVLIPHQFNVASAGVVVVLSNPTELPTIRLKFAVAVAVVVASGSASTLIPAAGEGQPAVAVVEDVVAKEGAL